MSELKNGITGEILYKGFLITLKGNTGIVSKNGWEIFEDITTSASATLKLCSRFIDDIVEPTKQLKTWQEYNSWLLGFLEASKIPYNLDDMGVFKFQIGATRITSLPSRGLIIHTGRAATLSSYDGMKNLIELMHKEIK